MKAERKRRLLAKLKALKRAIAVAIAALDDDDDDGKADDDDDD